MKKQYLEKTLPILEIFASIQGEGSYMGEYVVFIRTSGCNLKCPWCDTKESWSMDGVNKMTVDDILKETYQYGVDKVVITGGEPTIHGDSFDALLYGLKDRGYYICLETNGSNPVSYLVDWVTCSPKRDNPSGKYFIHPYAHPAELKYVVDSTFDAQSAIPEVIREAFSGLIWLQPEGNHMQDRWKDCYELASCDPRLRVGVQLHKIMEVQ